MFDLSTPQTVFVLWAFAFQLVLLLFFYRRKVDRLAAIRQGWWVYALAALGLPVGLQQLAAGEPWYFWIGGVNAALWALFGYWADYRSGRSWRAHVHWPIYGPYVLLYLSMLMFYWWPLGLIARPLWYAYALLFALSSYLNVTSH